MQFLLTGGERGCVSHGSLRVKQRARGSIPAHCLTSRMQMDILQRMMSSPSSGTPSRRSWALMLSLTRDFS